MNKSCEQQCIVDWHVLHGVQGSRGKTYTGLIVPVSTCK